MPSLKIISLNTWKCDGDYATRLDYMVRELLRIKPDIIALQECFRTENEEADTLKYLASKLQMKSSLVPGRFKKRLFNRHWVESYSDLGILSNLSISHFQQHNLPGVPEDPDRKVQMVTLSLPGSFSFLFINTHLTHLSKVPGLKKSQFDSLSTFIQAPLRDYPFALVCGDFNSQIQSEETREFIFLNQAIDTYLQGGGEEPRNSLVEALKAGKHYAVDHIFFIPNPIQSFTYRFLESKMVLNIPEPHSGIFPSDHFGIYTHMDF